MVNIIYAKSILCQSKENIQRELSLRNDKCLKCVSLVRSVFLETGIKECLAYRKNIILPVNFCEEFGSTNLDKWLNFPNCMVNKN